MFDPGSFRSLHERPVDDPHKRLSPARIFRERLHNIELAMFTAPTHPSDLVFAKDDGECCKFFVEAAAVRERPKLIRKITKNGGLIVNAARDADILLAENHTKEALELLEAWSSDKIVLSTRWVGRCLESNTFLGSNYGWAGHELTRKSLCEGLEMGDDASSEAEAEREMHSKKRKISRDTPTQRSESTASRRSIRPEPGPSRPRTSNASSTNRSRNPPSSQAERTDERRHINPSPNFHMSASRSPSENTLRLTQDPMPLIDTYMQSSFPSSSQAALLQQQQALFSTVFSTLLQHPQQPHTSDNLSSLGQYPNFPPFSPLVPSLQQFFAHQSAMNPHAFSPHFREGTEPSGLGFAAQRQEEGLDALMSAHSTHELSGGPTPQDVDVDLDSKDASVGSEEGEVELSISDGRHKGKERATSEPSDGEIQTAIRSNPPRPRNNISHCKKGAFADNQGVSKKFYVMVDLKNRKDLIKTVRKHDGTMVSQMDDADYIILNNRSNQFQTALNLLPIHKIALAPTWLEECEKAGKMVEMAPHVIDLTSGIGPGAARKKPIGKGHQPKRAKVECESEEDNTVELPTTPKASLAKDKARPQEENPSPIRPGSRSPSPPQNIVSGSGGRNLYTEDDRIWFFKYARFKLERDPYTSNKSLMQAMARRAPHHSARSWESAWRSKWHNEMNAIKEEIATLHHLTPVALPSSPTPPQPAHLQDSNNSYLPQRTSGELMYPDSSIGPVRNQLSHHSAPNNAPTSSATPVDSPRITPTMSPKRKDTLNDALIVDRQGQEARKGQIEVIDVDSYPDVWFRGV